MTGPAMHPSAEPDALVVKADVEDRICLLEDAPDTYYLTDCYRHHPVILAHVSQLDHDALRDLLSTAVTDAKNGEPHLVPATDDLIALIRAQQEVDDEREFLFVGHGALPFCSTGAQP